jgi:hypothetical protein
MGGKAVREVGGSVRFPSGGSGRWPVVGDYQLNMFIWYLGAALGQGLFVVKATRWGTKKLLMRVEHLERLENRLTKVGILVENTFSTP